MHDTLRDLRIGFRSLRQRPLFLAAAMITLGLGIGASTAVFSVIESALLQPLPFAEPDRLAVAWGVAGPERDIRGASPIEIADWDAQVDALGPLSRYNETTLNLSGEGGATQLEAEVVSPGFFGILGIAPRLGRPFAPEDDEPGAAGTAVISHELWQTAWGGGDVIGRVVRLDDVDHTIIGVMPQGFAGLSFDTEIWVPLGPFFSAEAMADRGSRWLAAIGRLAPGATETAAQSELSAAARRLEEIHPRFNSERGAMLLPLRDYYVQQARPLLLMVLGGVGLLLLIACANVANLQLVRTIERNREVALRYALGAGRARIGRQMVAESLVLAALGGAAGVALAWVGIATLLPLVPDGVLPPYARPGLDPAVLLFGLGAALGTGLLFGLAPALRAAGQDPAGALREASRGTTSRRRSGRRPGAQQAIIVAEVALALVLLVGAGLAIRSLRQQLAIEPGFRAERVLAARLSLTGDAYDAATRIQFAERLLERAGGIAGVDQAALVAAAPLRGYTSAAILRRIEDPEERIRYYRHSVSPSFFETLGIPILRGRGFTAADRMEAPGVVVVSEALSAKLWPGEEAVGRQLLIAGDTATIVGVAGDVHYRDLTTSLMDPGEDPDVYFAYGQLPSGSFDVLLRSEGDDPGTLTSALRAEIAALDRAIPLYDVAPMRTELDAQTALGRMVSTLLGVFGALALVVAAVGLYGVLAFVVRGRRREIAIRAALGAAPSAIRRMVVGQGLLLVGAGVLAGVVVALLAGRLLSSVLYGVESYDPMILLVTTLTLLAVSILAAYIPARQATRVDPHTAMSAD